MDIYYLLNLFYLRCDCFFKFHSILSAENILVLHLSAEYIFLGVGAGGVCWGGGVGGGGYNHTGLLSISQL